MIQDVEGSLAAFDEVIINQKILRADTASYYMPVCLISLVLMQNSCLCRRTEIIQVRAHLISLLTYAF